MVTVKHHEYWEITIGFPTLRDHGPIYDRQAEIIDWLEENVARWTDFEGRVDSKYRRFVIDGDARVYRFRVHSVEDAALVRLRFS